MNIKELIQHLRCFDKEHHVVVKDENPYHDDRGIESVEFDGRNCTITIEPELK